MKTFAERMREDQRLVILRLLLGLNSYKANSSTLTVAMDDLGHAVSRDQVKGQLRWLEEQALVDVDEPVPGVLVATLTERGADVAIGRAIVHGVSRPGA
jgi:hypothetical protein